MTRKTLAYPAILAAAMFCGVTLAQDPAVDISRRLHPNLYAAQRNVVEANRYVAEAQRENKYDMQGHAERARQLLVEVNQELKAAALAANNPRR